MVLPKAGNLSVAERAGSQAPNRHAAFPSPALRRSLRFLLPFISCHFFQCEVHFTHHNRSHPVYVTLFDSESWESRWLTLGKT